jgi:YesN/AraC family two-component response regulator
MTESYLSVFIKEWFASNFSTYLELLRIKKANELLDKGERPISGIAQAVGYTSSNSFGRAYKRVMGFSPSAYRKKSSREDRSGAVLSSEKLGD